MGYELLFDVLSVFDSYKCIINKYFIYYKNIIFTDMKRLV